MAAGRQAVSVVIDQVDSRPQVARQLCASGLIQHWPPPHRERTDVAQFEVAMTAARSVAGHPATAWQAPQVVPPRATLTPRSNTEPKPFRVVQPRVTSGRDGQEGMRSVAFGGRGASARCLHASPGTGEGLGPTPAVSPRSLSGGHLPGKLSGPPGSARHAMPPKSYTPRGEVGRGGATETACWREASFGAQSARSCSGRNTIMAATAQKASDQSPSVSPRIRLPSREERVPRQPKPQQGINRGRNTSTGNAQSQRGGRIAEKDAERGAHTPRAPLPPQPTPRPAQSPRSRNNSGSLQTASSTGTFAGRSHLNSGSLQTLPSTATVERQRSAKACLPEGGGQGRARGRQPEQAQNRQVRPLLETTPRRPNESKAERLSIALDDKCKKLSSTSQKTTQVMPLQPPPLNLSALKRHQAPPLATAPQQPTRLDFLADINITVPRENCLMEDLRGQDVVVASAKRFESRGETTESSGSGTGRASCSADLDMALCSKVSVLDDPWHLQQTGSSSSTTLTGRATDTPEMLDSSSFSLQSESSPMLQPPAGTWGSGVFGSASQASPASNVVMRSLVASITESFSEAIRSLSPCCHNSVNGHRSAVSSTSPRRTSPPPGSWSPFGPQTHRSDRQLRRQGTACDSEACQDTAEAPEHGRLQPPWSGAAGFLTPRRGPAARLSPRENSRGPDSTIATDCAQSHCTPQQQIRHEDIIDDCRPSGPAVHCGDVDEVEGVHDTSFEKSICGSLQGSPSGWSEQAVVADEISGSGEPSVGGRNHVALGDGFKVPELPQPSARRNPGTTGVLPAASHSPVTATLGGRGVTARPPTGRLAPGQPKQTVSFPTPPIHASEPVFHKGHHQGWSQKRGSGRTPPPRGHTSPRLGISPRSGAATTSGRRGGA